MALPLAGLDAQPARAIWLIVSLIVFIAGVAALVNYQALRNRDVSIPVLLLMLLSPAVFTNLRIGQGYLIVFGLFTATALLLIKGRDRAAGVCLGSLLAIKMSGVPIVLLLIARKRWTALAITGLTAAIVVIAITPFIDARMWTMFPSQVRAFVARPSGSVTAYQTTLSLARHLCIADPQWNPSPAANCAPIAFLVPALSRRRGHDRHARPGDAIAARRAVDRRGRHAGGAVPAGGGRVAFRPDGDSAGPAPADDHRICGDRRAAPRPA